DQHPAHADRPAGIAAPRQEEPLGGARLSAMERSAATAVAVQPGSTLRPAGAAAIRQRRLALASPRPRRRLDGGARFPGAGEALISGAVAGAVVNPAMRAGSLDGIMGNTILETNA